MIGAELIEDNGQAAASETDFFRSPPFLEAEGVTHTLRIDAGDAELLAPLIVRELDGSGERDAISPYGYPGFSRRLRPFPEYSRKKANSPEDRVDPTAIDFSGTGLVSAFVRHTLGEPPLIGARERNRVQIADPSLPRKQRSSDRNQINKNRRNGYVEEIVSGPGSDAAQRAGFLASYLETMRRTGAAERYFFDAAYFDRILAFDASWLAFVRAADGSVAAASIAVRSDGFLHYYLSGSADSHLRDSPMKNVVARLVELAEELGLPLNLGGGIAAGDRLEEFKRGFANREQAWHSSELVCDPESYARLSAGRPDAGFFPAYRGPA